MMTITKINMISHYKIDINGDIMMFSDENKQTD